MIKLKIALLTLGISFLSSATMAKSWIPCAQDTDFIWNESSDTDYDNARWIIWVGKHNNPDRPWTSIEEYYKGPINEEEVDRPEIAQSGANLEPYLPPHTDVWLHCKYTQSRFGTYLNLTKLGHTGCKVVNDPVHGWGAHCD